MLDNSDSAVVTLVEKLELAAVNEPDILLFKVESVKSTFNVIAPDVPPPLKPVPAVTPVISPASVAPILPDKDALRLVEEPLMLEAI